MSCLKFERWLAHSQVDFLKKDALVLYKKDLEVDKKVKKIKNLLIIFGL